MRHNERKTSPSPSLVMPSCSTMQAKKLNTWYMQQSYSGREGGECVCERERGIIPVWSTSANT